MNSFVTIEITIYNILNVYLYCNELAHNFLSLRTKT
jgi:hypothetical protein